MIRPPKSCWRKFEKSTVNYYCNYNSGHHFVRRQATLDTSPSHASSCGPSNRYKTRHLQRMWRISSPWHILIRRLVVIPEDLNSGRYVQTLQKIWVSGKWHLNEMAHLNTCNETVGSQLPTINMTWHSYTAVWRTLVVSWPVILTITFLWLQPESVAQ